MKKLYYHILITLIFIFIYVQFLSLKRTNIIYKIYADYILSRYCLLLYILLTLVCFKYDYYTGMLLLILIIAPVKLSMKEFFVSEDSRFKQDEIITKELLQQIKAQIDFDPHKTQLDKNVIYEIYNKYFNTNIFTKLKKNYDDSKNYSAETTFNYLPTDKQLDYDLTTYQNLSNNIQIGINPITDGIQHNIKRI